MTNQTEQINDCLAAKQADDAIRAYGVARIKHQSVNGVSICSIDEVSGDGGFMAFMHKRNRSVLLRIKYAAIKAMWAIKMRYLI